MNKYKKRKCQTHGMTDFVLEGRGYYRCKRCRADRVAEQRRKNKLKLIKACGGSCSICGYNRCPRAMHFHHLDKTTKSFGIAASGMSRSISQLLKETEKCVIVCSNCHMEIESGLVTLLTEWL